MDWSVDELEDFYESEPVASALGQVTQQAVDGLLEKRDAIMRERLESHDWDQYPILDFVWVEDVPHLDWQAGETLESFNLSVRVVIREHTSPAPHPVRSRVPDHRCEVQRVTRPLYEKWRRERPELFEA